MVQELSSVPSIGGSFGRGLGRGLSEHIPKEVERYRLAQGLQQFEQDSANLSPMQALARLSSIPGITPQMVQSFGELAKTQNTRNAYINRASARGQRNRSVPSQVMGQNANVPGMAQGPAQNMPMQGQQPEPQPFMTGQGQANVNQEPGGKQGIIDFNPLRQEAIPGLPLTPDQFRQEVADILESDPSIKPEEAEMLVNQEQKLRLSQPVAQQEIDKYKESVKSDIEKQFLDELKTALQTDDKGLFKDITGDNLLDLLQGLNEDIRKNPNKSKDQIVREWRERARDFTRTKGNIKELANQDLFNKITNSKDNIRSLNSYQKIYKDANQLRELYDLLRTEEVPPQFKDGVQISPGYKGFGMSNQGAAYRTFQISEKVKNTINKIPPSTTKNFKEHSYNTAEKVAQNLTKDDNILAILQDLRLKDPFFNQQEFLRYFDENADNLPLTRKQQEEAALPAQNVKPTWGDMLYLP